MVVTGRPTFIGKDIPMAIVDLEIEQKDPMIVRPHTWAVNVWAEATNSDDVTPGGVAWIKEGPPHARRPDLKAGCDEADVRRWQFDVPYTAKYVVVVVDVVEMTGGERSTVYATKTYAMAFKNHGNYEKDVVIPLCTDGSVKIAEMMGQAEEQPSASESH